MLLHLKDQSLTYRINLYIYLFFYIYILIYLITFECILDAFGCIFIDLIALGYSTQLNWAETIKVGRLHRSPTKHTLLLLLTIIIMSIVSKVICAYIVWFPVWLESHPVRVEEPGVTSCYGEPCSSSWLIWSSSSSWLLWSPSWSWWLA